MNQIIIQSKTRKDCEPPWQFTRVEKRAKRHCFSRVASEIHFQCTVCSGGHKATVFHTMTKKGISSKSDQTHLRQFVDPVQCYKFHTLQLCEKVTLYKFAIKEK